MNVSSSKKNHFNVTRGTVGNVLGSPSHLRLISEERNLHVLLRMSRDCAVRLYRRVPQIKADILSKNDVVLRAKYP